MIREITPSPERNGVPLFDFEAFVVLLKRRGRRRRSSQKGWAWGGGLGLGFGVGWNHGHVCVCVCFHCCFFAVRLWERKMWGSVFPGKVGEKISEYWGVVCIQRSLMTIIGKKKKKTKRSVIMRNYTVLWWTLLLYYFTKKFLLV